MTNLPNTIFQVPFLSSNNMLQIFQHSILVRPSKFKNCTAFKLNQFNKFFKWSNLLLPLFAVNNVYRLWGLSHSTKIVSLIKYTLWKEEILGHDQNGWHKKKSWISKSMKLIPICLTQSNSCSNSRSQYHQTINYLHTKEHPIAFTARESRLISNPIKSKIINIKSTMLCWLSGSCQEGLSTRPLPTVAISPHQTWTTKPHRCQNQHRID